MEGCDDTNDNARGADDKSAEQANALIKNKKKRRSESTSSQESGSLSPDLYSVDPEPKGVAATGSLALMEASGSESAEEALIVIKEKKDLILTQTSPEKIFSDLKDLEREVAGNIIHLRQVLRHSAKSEDLINKVYMQYRSAALEVQFHGDSKSRAHMAQSESARTVLEQLVRDRSDLLSVFPEKMDLINAHFTKEFQLYPTLAAAVTADGTTFVNRWLPVSSGEEKNLPETLNQQFQQGLSETVDGSVQLDSVVVEPRSPNQEIEKGAFPTGESREAIRSLGEARKSLEAGCSEALKNIDAVNAAEKSARLGKIHFLLSQVKEREGAYQYVIKKLKDINREVWKDLVWDEQPEGVKELLLKAGRAPVSIHALHYVLNNINVNVMVSPGNPAAVKSIVGSLIRAKAEILQLMDLEKDSSLKPALAVALAQRGVTRNHFALTDQQLKSVAIEGKERRMYDAILEGLEVSVRTAAAIVKAKKVEEIDAHIAKLDGLVIQNSITKNPKCKKRIEKEWLKLAPLSRKLVISMDPSVVPPPVLMAGYVLAHAKVWTWRNDGEAMLKQLAAYEKTFTDKQVKVRTEMVAAVHSTGLAQLLPKDSSDPLEKEIIGAVNKKKLFSNKPAIDLRNYKELLKCASERSVVLLVDPDVLVRERVEAYFGRLVSALEASGERRPELVQEYLDAIAAERKSLSDFVDRDDSVPPGEKDKQKQTLLESFSRVVSDVQASNPLVSEALAMEGFRDFGKSIVPQSGDDKIDRVIGSGGPAPAVNAAASATDLESILPEQSIETRTQVAKALSKIKRFSGDETAVEQKIHELGTKFKSDPVLMEAVKGRMLQVYKKKAFEETFTGGFDNDPKNQQVVRYKKNVMDQVRHFVREQLKGKDAWIAAHRQAQQAGVESDMLNALLPQMPTGFAEAMLRSLSNVSQSGVSLESMVAFLRDSGAVLRSFAVSVEEHVLFEEYQKALGRNEKLKNLINDEVGEIENPGELVEIATWLDRLEQLPAADAVGAIKILKKYQQFVDDEVKKLTRINRDVEMKEEVEQAQEPLNDAPEATRVHTFTLMDEMLKEERTGNNRGVEMIDPVKKAQELLNVAPEATRVHTFTLMDEILKGSELNKNSVKSDEEDASAEITQLAAELWDDFSDSSVDIPKSIRDTVLAVRRIATGPALLSVAVAVFSGSPYNDLGKAIITEYGGASLEDILNPSSELDVQSVVEASGRRHPAGPTEKLREDVKSLATNILRILRKTEKRNHTQPVREFVSQVRVLINGNAAEKDERIKIVGSVLERTSFLSLSEGISEIYQRQSLFAIFDSDKAESVDLVFDRFFGSLETLASNAIASVPKDQSLRTVIIEQFVQDARDLEDAEFNMANGKDISARLNQIIEKLFELPRIQAFAREVEAAYPGQKLVDILTPQRGLSPTMILDKEDGPRLDRKTSVVLTGQLKLNPFDDSVRRYSGALDAAIAATFPQGQRTLIQRVLVAVKGQSESDRVNAFLVRAGWEMRNELLRTDRSLREQAKTELFGVLMRKIAGMKPFHKKTPKDVEELLSMHLRDGKLSIKADKKLVNEFTSSVNVMLAGEIVNCDHIVTALLETTTNRVLDKIEPQSRPDLIRQFGWSLWDKAILKGNQDLINAVAIRTFEIFVDVQTKIVDSEEVLVDLAREASVYLQHEVRENELFAVLKRAERLPPFIKYRVQHMESMGDLFEYARVQILDKSNKENFMNHFTAKLGQALNDPSDGKNFIRMMIPYYDAVDKARFSELDELMASKMEEQLTREQMAREVLAIRRYGLRMLNTELTDRIFGTSNAAVVAALEREKNV
jgi:hypothetical protein